MKRALRVAPAGNWPREAAKGRVTLDFDARHRRRLRLATDEGEFFLLDLPRAVALNDGDGLALDDGGWIEVCAKAEPLLEVTAPPELLCRLAWHIGNRHIPATIERNRILIRDDHVIAEMLYRLGANLRHVREPFAPEAGAYADHDHHAALSDH
jgi:urease accessory protein